MIFLSVLEKTLAGKCLYVPPDYVIMMIENLDFNKEKYVLRAWNLDILICYGNLLW